MATDQERLQQLEQSYHKLWEQHAALRDEIRQNYAELRSLHEKYGIPPTSEQPAAPAASVSAQTADVPVKPGATIPRSQTAGTAKKPASGLNWEQYIGEQLLSKIGIAILIIGVAIGAKYAIDHNLTTPGMHITGGYIIAAVLGFFAYRFRARYRTFSAVLISGSMTVTYFITYAGFSFYHLYPHGIAFVLLLLTTAGTVYAALKYNQVVIAHIGLVGAYILPVLIRQQEAHFSNYLAYMALINAGILFISFMRSWRSLYYVAFGWTSLLMLVWLSGFFIPYHGKGDAVPAMLYAVGYFALFHTTVLAYPLLKHRSFLAQDLSLIVPNILVFLGIGHSILYAADYGRHAAFLFSILIAAVLFALWAIFRKVRQEDQLLQQSHLVMALSVLTLALIIELEGSQLLFTLVLETCILAWISVKSGWKYLDAFTIALLSLTACCFLLVLGSDWPLRVAVPFGNLPFWMIIAAIASLFITHEAIRRQASETSKGLVVVNGLLLFAVTGFYFAITSEILAAFSTVGQTAYATADLGSEYMLICAFTALYWLLIVVMNDRYYRFKDEYRWMETVSGILSLILLLIVTVLSAEQKGALGQVSISGLFLLGRYVTLASVFLLMLSLLRKYATTGMLVTLFHISLLWILSLEMTHWLSVSGNLNAYKLILSILWGSYAIYLLFTGMKKNIPALRVTAMIILGITLMKLFFFDIASLSTISKTIVFIVLGGLLLVGAYFYQRYKSEKEQPDKRE